LRIPSFTILNFYIAYSQQQNGSLERFRVMSSLDDLSKYPWIYSYFSEALCSKRFKDGCRLYYLLDDEGEPCSFAWFKKGMHHFVGEINRTIIYPMVVNCIFDCITPVVYRGKGYYPRLIKLIVNEQSEYATIIYASTSNIPSNKGILKSGFIPTHKILRFFQIINITAVDKKNKEQIKIYVQD